MDPNEPFSNAPLFGDLPPDQRAEVARRVRRRTFEANEALARRGDPGGTMYLLVSGKVKVSTTDEQDETILATLLAGDVIGELSLFDGEELGADVVALERTEALVLTSEDLHALVHATPAISIALMRGLAGRLRRATEWIPMPAVADVSARLARLLLDLSRTHGVDLPGGGREIRLRLTQNDMAALVGASRESVGKAMSYFTMQQWIAIDPGRHITILNPEALEKRCQG